MNERAYDATMDERGREEIICPFSSGTSHTMEPTGQYEPAFGPPIAELHRCKVYKNHPDLYVALPEIKESDHDLTVDEAESIAQEAHAMGLRNISIEYRPGDCATTGEESFIRVRYDDFYGEWCSADRMSDWLLFKRYWRR